MAKLITKNLLASLLLVTFVVAILGLAFDVVSEIFAMPFTWLFILITALPLTACLAICDYK